MIHFLQMLAKVRCFNHFSTKDVTGTWICAVDDANTCIGTNFIKPTVIEDYNISIDSKR